MSNHTANMKAYRRQLNVLRKHVLQFDENLAPDCNAHFLLGLVKGVSKTFHSFQDIG